MCDLVANRRVFNSNEEILEYMTLIINSPAFDSLSFDELNLSLYAYNNILINRLHQLIIERVGRFNQLDIGTIESVLTACWQDYSRKIIIRGYNPTERDYATIEAICFFICLLEFPNYMIEDGNDWSKFDEIVSMDRLVNVIIPAGMYAQSTFEVSELLTYTRKLRDTREKNAFEAFGTAEFPGDPTNVRDYDFKKAFDGVKRRLDRCV